MKRWFRHLTAAALAAGFVTGGSPSARAADADDPCTECQRRQRKVFEALQAWRRTRGGEYPLLLKDLETAGFLKSGGHICPAMSRELQGGSSRHDLLTVRGSGGDAPGGYEYELGPRAWTSAPEFYRNGKPLTRRDIKLAILRKPFWEQVPVLRCPGHRAAAPPGMKGGGAFRNFTAEGRVYWSGDMWEKMWSADVPMLERGGFALLPGSGPPFHSGSAPPLPGALDLRPWVNSVPRLPWWWGDSEFYKSGAAPDLRIFFPAAGGQEVEAGGMRYWVDGLVQTQGRVENSEGERGWSFPSAETFPYDRLGLKVDRRIRRASWLQATAWSAYRDDMKVATLVWRYQDGETCSVPVEYNRDVWRFASDVKFFASKKAVLPAPAFSAAVELEPGEPKSAYQINVWRQTWENPRPDEPVKSLDLVGNRNGTAGLFLLAVTVE